MNINASNKNNLITKAISNLGVEKTNNTNNSTNNNTNNSIKKSDSFETQKQNNKNILKSDILKKAGSFLLSSATLVAMFLIPEILLRRSGQKGLKDIKKLNNYKPLIAGTTITEETQNRLKNNNIKITLKSQKDKFHYEEITILKNNKVINRIIIKKEELPNEKLILRNIKSYKGENIADNTELKNNLEKFLFKEYKRSPIKNKSYKTKIIEQGKEPRINIYKSTCDGTPVLKTTENGNSVENTMYLYSKDTLVGIDKKITNKNNPQEEYNILNIPNKNIKNKKYNYKTDGEQYNRDLLQKLAENY